MDAKNIPSYKIEPLVTKLVSESVKHVNILSEYYSKGWMRDKYLDTVVNIVLVCYSKYSKLPTWKTIDVLLSKYFDDEGYNEACRKVEEVKAIDLSEYDDDVLDEEFLRFIRNTGFYITMFQGLDKVEKREDIDKEIAEQIQKYANVSFNEDLGLIYTQDIEEHIQEIQKPDSRIPFGLSNLDHLTKGGPWREGKNLSVFIGEAHMGKSLMLSNIALNMALNGNFVVIYSMEMSETVYGMRIDAHIADVPLSNVDRHTNRIRQSVTQLKTYGNGEIAIKEFPSGQTNINHIKEHLERLCTHLQREPDAVFVDYLSLLTPAGQTGNSLYERVGKVSEEVRALSYKFRCPHISANQINREGYDNSCPSLSKMSDSMKVAHDADFISFLWQDEGDEGNGVLRQVIRKDRFGGSKNRNMRLAVNGDSLRVYPYGSDNEENSENDIATQLQGSMENSEVNL